MIKPIKRILIANRGEIAVRIIQTCRRLGIACTAVYSEADHNSPHVMMADSAVFLGASPSRESYLNMEKLINAALESGCDAIHPGYGFLSENALFASAVENAGLVFIGPSPYSIDMMGNKLAAKKAAKDFNIPMVPGSDHAVTDKDEARLIANDISYPLLIKAAAGGGGKGMRIVNSESELEAQVERAMSEALASFGDNSVFIEKYVASPRHIEVQVFGDNAGNHIHLFERECSVQRRHQKIIEEAPSSILNAQKRTEMGADAIRVAKSCNYTGAGTVEFLLDENGNHFFLEMNTRLQVEHPVTEMITGLDLVEIQIRIAEGHELEVKQDEIKMLGHSIELRVYAEDVANTFAPSTGTLTVYRPPHGEGIRVDDGYREGMNIPIHYDPMISKLIVHAETRIEAIELMKKAIINYKIQGVNTTLQFGNFTMNHPDFVSGKFTTHFVEENIDQYMQELQDTDAISAMFAAWYYEEQKNILVLPEII